MLGSKYWTAVVNHEGSLHNVTSLLFSSLESIVLTHIQATETAILRRDIRDYLDSRFTNLLRFVSPIRDSVFHHRIPKRLPSPIRRT